MDSLREMQVEEATPWLKRTREFNDSSGFQKVQILFPPAHVENENSLHQHHPVWGG